MTHLAKRRSLAALSLALAAAACSMFDPPPEGAILSNEGGINTNGSGGSGLATDGAASTGGAVSTGGTGPAGGNSGQGGSGSGANAGSSGTAGGSADGGPLDSEWWVRSNQRGCTTMSAPKPTDRPAASDPGKDLAPLYFAMSRVRFGAVNDDVSLSANGNAWSDIGVDIDGVCTSSLGCEVNQVTVDERACKSPAATPPDGSLCRDNEIGRLFNSLAGSSIAGTHFGMTEVDWNCELFRGGFGVILKISEYNGQPNDRSVRADLYASTGLQTLPSWKCRETLDGAVNREFYRNASWVRSDSWRVVEDSIDLSSPVEGTEVRGARAADPAAFVRGGYLVARFPEGTEFWLNGERASVPGFRFTMHRSVLIAGLVKEREDQWVIDQGTLGFVTRPDEMLQGLRQIGFCENMCSVFDFMSQYFYTHQDTLEGTAEILPDTQCNAVSVGVDFEARQATATTADVVQTAPTVSCPQPKNPAAPRQGCTCQTNGQCT
jgi:hypothetical protein